MNRSNAKNSDFYLGQVSFSGIGGFQEKMISALLEEGIQVRRIRFSNGTISGEVSPFDYYKTAKTARKNGVKIRAGKRRGLYFTLSKYRFRGGLYAGLLVFAALLSIWQTRVQDITVTGEVSRSQVLQILDECGIKLGEATSGLNMSKAEHKLMMEVENCAWVDVSCEGFRVNVHIEKGVEVPEMEDSVPRNIVASRPAKIVRQIVRNGASVIGNGSGVNTGDMLVSGTVPDGRDKVLIVRSDAQIIGEWNETREFFVPFNETVSIANGSEKTFKYLIFHDDEYPLFWGKAQAEDSVYTEETSIVMLFGEQTPLKIKTGKYTAYTHQNITRSPDDVCAELHKLKQDYEQNFYSEYDIINVEEKFLPEETGIRLILEYTLQGDIAKPVPIEFDSADTENLPEISAPDQSDS